MLGRGEQSVPGVRESGAQEAGERSPEFTDPEGWTPYGQLRQTACFEKIVSYEVQVLVLFIYRLIYFSFI